MSLLNMTVVKTLTGIVAVVSVILGLNRFYFQSEQCVSGTPEAIKYLTTKTPYLRHDERLFNHSLRSRDELIPPGCLAESLWVIVRHGTRNPGVKNMKFLVKDLQKLQQEILNGYINKTDSKIGPKLCESVLRGLEDWNPHPNNLKHDEEKFLVEQGHSELHKIGKRFKERFPNLFNQKYDRDHYNFRYTKTQRAEASAKEYVKAALGDDEASKVVYPEAERAHPVLRFYKACARWKKTIDKNPETYVEKRAFENSADFGGMLERLATRLKLNRHLTVREAEIMYLACSFETAWHNGTVSPWCNVFEEEDLQVLEYREDLEYYWVDGYGHQLTYEQACAPIADVVDQFKAKIDGKPGYPTVSGYFTHSGTLLKLLCRIGLFKDKESLTSASFSQHRTNRLWRTSIIDKFATNIGFVLFKCSEEGVASTYKVGLLFQEDEIEAPFCDGGWICPFEKFQSYFEEPIRNCSDKVLTMCQLADDE